MQPGVAITPSTPQAPGNAIPEEILARWSWGPFFLWLFWVWWNADQTHKIIAAALFVCSFIPILNLLAGPGELAFGIYLGLKGNRLMAANRQFTSTEQFVAVQTAWAKWGVILFIVSIVMFALFMALFGLAMIAAMTSSASRSH